MLAHTEEAADADDDVVDLAGLVENHVADVADLLVVVVVDIDAGQLRGAPLAGLMHRAAVAAAGGSVRVVVGVAVLGIGRTGHQGSGQKCDCKLFGNHGVAPPCGCDRTTRGQELCSTLFLESVGWVERLRNPSGQAPGDGFRQRSTHPTQNESARGLISRAPPTYARSLHRGLGPF